MTKTTFIRLFFYFFGFFLTAFGVTALIRSRLGAGPWDTVTNNLSALIGITLGQASMTVNACIVLFLLIVNRKSRYIFTVVPIVAIGLFIDVWDILILGDLFLSNFFLQLLFFALGVFFITSGLAIVIVTGFPAMIFDELTFTLMRLIKSESFFKVRLFVEFFAITLAIILGFLASIGFGAVNVGSILLALTIGPLINYQIHLVRNLMRLKTA